MIFFRLRNKEKSKTFRRSSSIALTFCTLYLGRSFGIAKSFQSNHTSLATPRRALGDVQNTLQAGTTKARKGLALRPNKPCGKTPGATKVLQSRTGTPATKGLPLLQQISSAGLKQSTKQKHTSHARTKEKQKVKAQQQELCEKEVMYPFTEQGG